MIKKVSISDRLINFIVDTLAFTIIAIITIIILKNSNQNFKYYNVNYNRLLAFTIYFSYYFIFELVFSSTIGKLVTSTKVVDSSTLLRPSVVKLIIRTLCRFIPFEFVSMVFNDKNLPLHDILSRTIVIKKP